MQNKQSNIYHDVITAILTPYKKDGDGNLEIDYAAFSELVRKQIASGINGIVIAGSTGEGTCLKIEQIVSLLLKAKEVKNQCVDSCDTPLQLENANKFAIICGLASASTSDAVKALEYINATGIDGLMLTAPHYVKPSREGVRRYFEILASSTDLQVILYSNKSRTGIEINVDDVYTLSNKLHNIVALKDSESDIIRPLRIYKNSIQNSMDQGSNISLHQATFEEGLQGYSETQNPKLYGVSEDLIAASYCQSPLGVGFTNLSNGKCSKRPFNILSGNDENYLVFYMHGAQGVVSVISNIMPKSMRSLNKMLIECKYAHARYLQCQLLDIYDAIYAETNPSGVKYAASLLGLCNDYVAMPLMEVSDETKKRIQEVLPKIKAIESVY